MLLLILVINTSSFSSLFFKDKHLCYCLWLHIISSCSSQIQAAPMQSILTRLRQQEYIKLIIFSDHTILNEPVEKWPLCNCLVAFYSKVATMWWCFSSFPSQTEAKLHTFKLKQKWVGPTEVGGANRSGWGKQG